METGNKKAYAAIALAAVNVAVFLYLAFGGPTEDGAYMLEHGAMYVPRMLEYGEYYRLFSSMFLHFGFQHLFNNMVMLLMVGWNLELEIGIGYAFTKFDRYECIGSGERLETGKTHHYVGPTKAAVNLIYVF